MPKINKLANLAVNPNKQRTVKEEQQGKTRWLRPEYQEPLYKDSVSQNTVKQNTFSLAELEYKKLLENNPTAEVLLIFKLVG